MTPRRILLCLDKFKGSLTAEEATAALRRGLLSRDPDLGIEDMPVADGGDGTLDVFLARGYRAVDVTVTGPRGDEVESVIAVDGTTAVVETARTSGLVMMGERPLDPLGATSRGVGDAIRASLDAGAQRIILGLGGSATTDGGAGMLQALGARLLDSAGRDLGPGGGVLGGLAAVDLSGLDPRLADADVVLASDVTNPLTGPSGAAAVYGPQKGASEADVETLDAGLARLGELLDPNAMDRPGAGAAGGIGYAALAALGAQFRPGIEIVLEALGAREAMARADLVITGEGRLDEQSLQGKAPSGVLDLAASLGVPVTAVCGLNELGPDGHGFTAVYALADIAPDAETSMREAARLLEELGARLDLG
ncbi:glycerate kinase [Falsarthrobacter nasiphocae]|uniref:Glycerate kinase n=1 Tax=Falsarthrobacter nasiphocae TaxID=189863 RepID=A0AAE4C4X9_9MICC|nr:glycerate kinase [Falsarthrobacter nasiphocae]MDR6891786.1 glycerate kinase [Falsarthrobacter nasiphocae]